MTIRSCLAFQIVAFMLMCELVGPWVTLANFAVIAAVFGLVLWADTALRKDGQADADRRSA